jgi:hypothetical protein
MLKSVLVSMIVFVLLVHAYTRTTNVIPGEADYPNLNANPMDFLVVMFQIPTSVHVHFTLFYAGASARESHPKPSACHFVVQTGSETEYTITLHEYWKADPLNLTLQSSLPDQPGLSKDIKIYSASIPVDRYEGGRCHWQFDELAYSLDADPTTQMPVFFFTSDAHGGSSLFRFLCAKHEATRESRQQELCGGPRLDYATWLYRRPEERNAFFNDPQANVRNGYVAIGSAVTVEFHDIDNVVQSPPDVIY